MKTILINKSDLIKEIEKEKRASAILTSCCESYQDACTALDIAQAIQTSAYNAPSRNAQAVKIACITWIRK